MAGASPPILSTDGAVSLASADTRAGRGRGYRRHRAAGGRRRRRGVDECLAEGERGLVAA
jgi:hypothetical protein